MPSPIGHALGGLIAGAMFQPSGGRPNLAALLLVMGAAVAPDLDFLWGRHTMETHSVGAAMLAGLAVLAWTRGRAWRPALAVTVAWGSHVLFDWLGSDTTPPLGVMALWPFDSSYYFADAFVFEAISRRTHVSKFWSHNLWAVATEVMLLGPLAALAMWHRSRPR